MGSRSGSEDRAGAASRIEARLSRVEHARSCPRADRLPLSPLSVPGKTNALRVLGRELARYSPRNDRQAARRTTWLSSGETRPFGFASNETGARFSRRAPLWPRPISSWQISARLVARRRTGHPLHCIRSEILRRISQASRASADQIGFASAKRIRRHRQLDGGRNSLARKARASTSRRQPVVRSTRSFISRDSLRRDRIAPHHQSGIWGSPARLVDPSKMETRRDLSAASNAAAQSDDRRAEHPPGSARSAPGHVYHDFVKSTRA